MVSSLGLYVFERERERESERERERGLYVFEGAAEEDGRLGVEPQPLCQHLVSIYIRFSVRGLGFWVHGSGFGIQDLGFQGFGFRVQGSGFEDVGFRVQDLEIMVYRL